MRRSSRRDFLATTALSLGAVPLVRLAATTQPDRAGGTVFRHGVASGDPLADRVMLWTRVTTARAGRGGRELDASRRIRRMTRIVARGEGRTGACARLHRQGRRRRLVAGDDVLLPLRGRGAAVAGRPHAHAAAQERRRVFVSASRRARTIPSATSTPTRRSPRVPISMPSCTSATTSTSTPTTASVTATRLGRVPSPDKEIVALADYRAAARAVQGRSRTRRRCTASIPFIVVWDDHELTNNAWSGGAENHDPEQGEGDWYVRRNAAVQAFFEWMPIREDAQALSPRIYRTLQIRRPGRSHPARHAAGRAATSRRRRATTSTTIESPTRSLLGIGAGGLAARRADGVEARGHALADARTAGDVRAADRPGQARRQRRLVGRLPRLPRPRLRHDRAG